VNGGRERSKLLIGPVRIALGGELREVSAAKKRRAALAVQNAANLTFTQDLSTHAGSIGIEGNIAEVADFLKLAAELGRPLTHGWELTGQATAATQWVWKEPCKGFWNGAVELNKGSLSIAGLNQPLDVAEAKLNWAEGRRTAQILKVGAFGASWTGTIDEKSKTDAQAAPNWKFDLKAEQLNVAELDRWVGPRARPNWLQRLLRSFLGEVTAATAPSELVRRVDAEGQLHISRLTVEKLKLENVVAHGLLRNLRLDLSDVEAESAGGRVQGRVVAGFLPQPHYEITADLDRVQLAKLPGTGGLAERVSGEVSGSFHLQMNGVGREELLQHLRGEGKVRLQGVELRGWDVPASVALGAARTGTSRWPAGECAFLIRNRGLDLQWLRLNGRREQTSVEGTLSFGSELELSVSTHAIEKTKTQPKKASAKGHVLRVSGPLDGPRVSVEKPPEPQVVD
jgi:hypothetical protein